MNIEEQIIRTTEVSKDNGPWTMLGNPNIPKLVQDAVVDQVVESWFPGTLLIPLNGNSETSGMVAINNESWKYRRHSGRGSRDV